MIFHSAFLFDSAGVLKHARLISQNTDILKHWETTLGRKAFM